VVAGAAVGVVEAVEVAAEVVAVAAAGEADASRAYCSRT